MKKKILILLLIITFVLTGCRKNDKTLNENYRPFEPDGKYLKDEKYKEYEKVNEEIISGLEDIVIGENNIFKNMATLDDNSIETELGLTTNDFKNYVIKTPVYGIIDSTYCIIYIPEKGKEERIKIRLNSYFESKKAVMESNIDSMDYSSKLQMLNNMKITEINNYIIYVSSPNNDYVIEELKKIIK